MEILVLGGTGAIGKALVDNLKKENTVYVTSRKKQADEERVVFLQGNAMDEVFLKEVLKKRKWDCIVDFMAYESADFYKKVKLFLESTKQYIFLSSARVYNYCEDIINENSYRNLDIVKDKSFLKTKDYSLEKAREENILKEATSNNWTILRPYKTYSSDRLQLGFLEKENWLYRCLQGKSIVFSEDLFQAYTCLSSSKDVAVCIAKMIGNQSCLGETYQVITGETTSWKDILEIYCKTLQKRGYKADVYLGKSAYDIWKGRPDYTIQYDSLKNHIFDNSKMESLLSKEELDSFSKTEEELSKFLDDFLENPHFGSVDWKQEAKFDCLTGERTRLCEIPGWKNRLLYLGIRYLNAYYIILIFRWLKYKL